MQHVRRNKCENVTLNQTRNRSVCRDASKEGQLGHGRRNPVAKRECSVGMETSLSPSLQITSSETSGGAHRTKRQTLRILGVLVPSKHVSVHSGLSQLLPSVTVEAFLKHRDSGHYIFCRILKRIGRSS